MDNRTKELYARVFDMGDDLEQDSSALPQIQKEIRLAFVILILHAGQPREGKIQMAKVDWPAD